MGIICISFKLFCLGFKQINPKEKPMSLNEKQIHRYSRNILLKEISGSGQEKMLNAKILIKGRGLRLTSNALLAAAGVGTIGIVDADDVDLSNLQRQIIHFTTDYCKI